MKTQFVSYEIALQLKELGFDEPCFGYFNSDEEFIYGIDIKMIEYAYKYHKEDDAVLAPLWQQVIDFFREKYDLSIEIQRNVHIDTWKYNIITIHQPGVYLIQTVNESKHNSIQFSVVREQAILKAIKTCQK